MAASKDADPAGSALMQGLGLQRVVGTEPAGRARLEFLAQAHHCHSVVQGGYVTAWVDAAMASAVGAATEGAFGCNTLEMKVAFYRPAVVGQLLLAEGWVERMGRSIAFLEGELRGPDGAVLAKASSTAKLARFPGPESG